MQENTYTLTYQKLFQLQRTTLEDRISTYYDQTRNEKNTIKYLAALQIREELSIEDFSFVLRELVRHIFLKTKATRALRRYYYLFQHYFGTKEWKLLTSRLFTIKHLIVEKIAQLMNLVEQVHSETFSVP
ncbi:hypothetical protein [Enterococcus sp. AZ072]|uniref:hypothetical protein n=1 Tax=unclassified Enterococcus TaxID=2608891 RepID=UPI003D294B7D